MNVYTFSGNLGRDAEVKTIGAGTVCNFAVAVKSGFGDKEKTEWISCAMWGKRAEGGLPQYLKKGQTVVVSGELSTREYQNSDGITKTVLEVRVAEVTLVGKRDDAPVQHTPAPQAQQAPMQQQAAPQHAAYDDSIPF